MQAYLEEYLKKRKNKKNIPTQQKTVFNSHKTCEKKNSFLLYKLTEIPPKLLDKTQK